MKIYVIGYFLEFNFWWLVIEYVLKYGLLILLLFFGGVILNLNCYDWYIYIRMKIII